VTGSLNFDGNKIAEQYGWNAGYGNGFVNTVDET
jgi:hypothetical protein